MASRLPQIRPRKGQRPIVAWLHELGYCQSILEYAAAGEDVGDVNVWQKRLERAQGRVKVLASDIKP